ncbi:Ldh family oxidoreductase [Acetomicrobium sp. S15 = DSM 107314]|uniref:Ldh family oxidoreductase n=1 Tax=Acetomicrobium sp. S15 = DSM 107314 TaxID=2529858 RepID=UPI0018E1B0E3|nr:Ldh family oxidoreductase [Acetomicrobium sp. S15 = DSM 107314]
MNRYSADSLVGFCKSVFVKIGVDADKAHLVSDSMVKADLRGVSSHGVTRTRIYVDRIRRGLVDPKAEPEIIRERAATALVDAKNGIGQVVSQCAMGIAVKKAREAGVGFVGVAHSNHFGMAAYYTLQAVGEGMIGVAMTNAPATMAPWGARLPYMGTNPLSVAVPADKRLPIVLDMATSVVARGKIILAAQKGEKIPEGWAIDKEGRVTTDPKAALEGAVLPFGGAKGSAIAILIDVLSGILTGASFGPHLGDLYRNFQDKQDIGHAFYAIDPASFGDAEVFKARIDQMIDEIKALPPAHGFDEVFIPGEIEFRNEEKRRAEGIPLAEETEKDLIDLARELGVIWPETLP